MAIIAIPRGTPSCAKLCTHAAQAKVCWVLLRMSQAVQYPSPHDCVMKRIPSKEFQIGFGWLMASSSAELPPSG